MVGYGIMDIIGQNFMDVSTVAATVERSAEILAQVVKQSSKCSSDRTRVVLSFKKATINLYFEFLNEHVIIAPEEEKNLLRDLHRNSDSTNKNVSGDDDVKKDSKKHHVKTIKSFLLRHNSTRAPKDQLHHGCVFKWLKAYYRGEFEAWGGLNDLSKTNAKAQKIMDHIYHTMKVSDPETAHWHKIIRKSRLSPDK